MDAWPALMKSLWFYHSLEEGEKSQCLSPVLLVQDRFEFIFSFESLKLSLKSEGSIRGKSVWEGSVLSGTEPFVKP